MTALELGTVGLATLQDGGRRRYAAVGVPASGAWDTRSLAQLCGLAGSDAWPVIESWSGDIGWNVPEAPVVFAVSGPAQVAIDGVVTGAPLTMLSAPAGARVHVQRVGSGPVMALVPGLQARTVLGSVSYDSFSGLGEPPLAPGRRFRLDADAQAVAASRVGAFARAEGAGRSTLDAVLHGRFDGYLLDRGWIVADVSRSGVRLRPDPAREGAWQAPDWASGPVLPGVVQVPPDGCPIILGPDAGTTGGYPVAGVLTERALCAIAYAEPGASLRFRSVTPPAIDPEVTSPVLW